jgi:hypothetical protein
MQSADGAEGARVASLVRCRWCGRCNPHPLCSIPPHFSGSWASPPVPSPLAFLLPGSAYFSPGLASAARWSTRWCSGYS